ncbi:MAG: hypothetical protein WC283_03080 [Candidatus Paceibacterota bacterium]|jgi:hypothetical protein
MKQKIYENIDQWYFPEIDYQKMINNFRYTKDPLRELVDKKYSFPLRDIVLMFHSRAWEYDLKTKQETYGSQQQFQFWNKQFNDELEKILKKLKPKLILEVGAGDGTLSKILSDRGFNVIATDNYSWPFRKRFFKVNKIDYKKALEKYQPDVVINSWMPLGTDWTKDFRKAKSVKHYITIGEVDACCGGDWTDRKTWPARRQDKASSYALCRSDSCYFHDNDENRLDNFMMHHSAVYLFSRRRKI